MHLKKCLRTSRGWSFIEYAIITVAICVGAVVILQQTLSDSGRIRNAFRTKADCLINTVK